MIEKIENNFSVFIALALVFGLAFPKISIAFNPYIVPMLMGIMFLTILKIDSKDFFKSASKPFYLVYLSSLILIISPIFFYYFSKLFYPEIAIATLIIIAMPAAMASTSLTDLLGGNASLSLLLTTITSLLAPFTVPFLILILAGVKTQANFLDMLLLLSEVIFIPFIAALLSRKLFPLTINKTKKYYSSTNIFLLFLVIIGPVGNNAEFILSNFNKAIYISIFFIIVSVLLHLVGWYATFWRPREDRIAAATTIAYFNITLGIVFASKFFSPLIVLAVVLYNVPWNMMLIPFQLFLKRGIYST
ncbi:MAG: bile acid:sodium symporter family protein [Candidatus Methanofastidiosia archaeon]